MEAPPLTPSSDTNDFAGRHVGPSTNEIRAMLDAVGAESLDDLMAETIPNDIRSEQALDLPDALTERELSERVSELAAQNDAYRSYIGMGYRNVETPPVIRRNILENPNWYTQYTPYQAEIAQGRLQMLLNFQTMVIDLTGLEIANASLLDEATAAAEAMMMLNRLRRSKGDTFFVSADCHPQTIDVVKARARPIDVEIVVGDHREFEFSKDVFGALVQYPATDGAIYDYEALCEEAHEAGAHVAAAADLLALTTLRAPGAFGADVVVGSSQRFGVPMGYGGPHAAFFATREKFQRKVPGRMIGVTKDASGKAALRMALQTREQHIRRGRATSNICTAQVLLAIMAAAYAQYHGPDGLRRIAGSVHRRAKTLADGLRKLGHDVRHDDFFDTLRIDLSERSSDQVREIAEQSKINLRYYEDGSVGVSLDKTVREKDLDDLLAVFGAKNGRQVEASDVKASAEYDGAQPRESDFMAHEVFNDYHSETELMRYLHRQASRDLSLTHSMIPLGSCTMKLNAAAELEPISTPSLANVHPFAPTDQTEGYQSMMTDLRGWLAEITGFDDATLQPNSGAAGEYTGMLVIQAYHESRGEGERDVCLIPESAHGTNPASATMAGMNVVTVECHDGEEGQIVLDDLREKAEEHADKLAALMITYPSTHGVFEEDIREVCDVVHEHGGQVYLDGANMNAQLGLCRPGEYGADVCHLNLHKTFAIPHGGGGPGVGPVCAKEHLAPFLPGHPVVETGGDEAIGPVAAAPYGSALVCWISWAYIAMMGAGGLERAAKTAVLNANYLAERIGEAYGVAFEGNTGRVAHEFILDLRRVREETDLSEADVAKRLMDYGFHAPTMSWPVLGTMMVEPTESESKAEIDRFAEAMLQIREEIRAVENGDADAEDNVLANAPHTAEMVASDDWPHAYGREEAAYPAERLRRDKFWPAARRVDDAYGDRNLICACPPMEAYAGSD
jgi:glycine dehydrogenase